MNYALKALKQLLVPLLCSGNHCTECVRRIVWKLSPVMLVNILQS